MGMAYLAALARQAGHEAAGVEGVFLGSPKAVARRVAELAPDVVGTSVRTQERFVGLEMIRQIRRALPEAFIVVGGPHFSQTAEDAMAVATEIDAVVVGEGERTFMELLERLPGREGLDQVNGLVFRNADGQVVRNPPREPMPDISHLPVPAYDLFPISEYVYPMIDREATPIIGVMTSRGCPQSCVFCANSLDRKVRFLDPAVAVDQIEWLGRTFGVTGLGVWDDDFLASNRHATAFCEELLRRNCKVTWWTGARPAKLDAEVLKLMLRAGCKCISFGVETGTDEVLRAAGKNTTTAQIRQAMEVAGRIGFQRVNTFLIIGLPGETTDTIDRTIAFVKSLKPLLGSAWYRETDIGQLPLVYPGTELAVMARAQDRLPKDFSWNRPYLEPKRHLPLVNHRYQTVPHYENPHLPLETICAHLKKHHWGALSRGRRRRFRLASLRRLKVAVGLR